MAVVRTGYSCPACKRTSGDTNEVYADGGRLVCSKVPEHAWADQSDFIDARPTIDFAQEQPRTQPQANHTSLNVSVPVNVANALLNRYADKRDATIAAALAVLAEGDTLTLSETEMIRLGQWLPEKPKNGSHLVGMIFAMQQSVQEAREVSEQMSKDIQAYRGMAPGRVVVDLGEQFKYAKERAEADSMPVEVWVSKNLKNALENSWF